MKLKSFCIAKETINIMEWYPSEWQNTFANEAIVKGLISKMHKELMQLSIKKQIKKLGTRYRDISPKKIYRCPRCKRKEAQYHKLLEKCNSELQWSIISHQSEWTSSEKTYKQ